MYHRPRLQASLLARRFTRAVCCCTVVPLLIALTGCLVAPVPMTKKVEGAAQAPEKKQLDLSFLQAGHTTKQEVMQRLDWSDTGVKHDRLFWGRWVSSGSGWFWIVMGPPGNAAGDSWRNWRVHNLLVEFDDQGIVRESRDVPDTQLLTELRAWIAKSQLPALDTATPVKLPVTRRRHGLEYAAFLILAKDSFEFKDPDWESRGKFVRIAPADITGIEISTPHHPYAEIMEGTLHFSKKNKLPSKVKVQMRADGFLVLLRYLQQNSPASSPK